MPSPYRSPTATATVLTCLATISCASYEPEPLNVDAIFSEIAATPPPDRALSFSDAVRHMLDQGPTLADARHAVMQARAVRDAGVPLPNPRLTAGLLLLDGPGLTDSLKRGFEVALGIRLPTGERRAATASLDEARLAARQIELVTAVHRAFLDLRDAWTEAAFAVRDLELARARRQLAARIEQRTRTLADRGRSSALEVQTAAIDRSDAEREELLSLETLLDQRTRIAKLCGVSVSSVGTSFEKAALEDAVEISPSTLRDHPDLRELAADYEIQEQSLRLQIALQYPDLTLFPNLEREGKTDRWGLGIGISLPIFDRNQRSIAEAVEKRARSRARYVSRARRLTIEMERGAQRLALARRVVDTAEAQLDSSRKLRDLAMRGVENGTFSPWRYLEVERRHRMIERRALEAERTLHRRHLEYERATGQLWIRFGTKTRDEVPDSPDDREDR